MNNLYAAPKAERVAATQRNASAAEDGITRPRPKMPITERRRSAFDLRRGSVTRRCHGGPPQRSLRRSVRCRGPFGMFQKWSSVPGVYIESARVRSGIRLLGFPAVFGRHALRRGAGCDCAAGVGRRHCQTGIIGRPLRSGVSRRQLRPPLRRRVVLERV